MALNHQQTLSLLSTEIRNFAKISKLIFAPSVVVVHSPPRPKYLNIIHVIFIVKNNYFSTDPTHFHHH